jgi:hypothetical protein
MPSSPVQTLILIIVLVAAAVIAVRSAWRAWARYRARIAMLKKAERDPSILNTPDDAKGILDQAAGPPLPARTDYTVMGVTLGVIGTSCIFAGKFMHVGQLAVGTFLGGIICFCLGLLLSLFGLLIRGTKRG